MFGQLIFRVGGDSRRVVYMDEALPQRSDGIGIGTRVEIISMYPPHKQSSIIRGFGTRLGA